MKNPNSPATRFAEVSDLCSHGFRAWRFLSTQKTWCLTQGTNLLDIQDDKGQVVRWQAELGGRTGLTKNFGWNKNTLKFGDKLTITGRRVKSGAPYINMTEKANIVMTDTGKEIFRTPNYEPPGAGAKQ